MLRTTSLRQHACRDRGTEFTKPPEMLRVDVRKPGEPLPGPPADVWGMGCLLYELLTTHMLYDTKDPASHHVRVTTDLLVRTALVANPARPSRSWHPHAQGLCHITQDPA